MNKKTDEDLASELMKIFDEETKKLFGGKEAEKIRKNINKRLEEKGLDKIDWN